MIAGERPVDAALAGSKSSGICFADAPTVAWERSASERPGGECDRLAGRPVKSHCPHFPGAAAGFEPRPNTGRGSQLPITRSSHGVYVFIS